MVSGLSDARPLCHLNLATGYRGGERQTEILVREFASRGVSQRLVVKRGSVLRQRCERFDNVDVREVAPNPLAAAIAAKGSGVVHAHDGRTVYSGLIAKLLFGIPYVITRRVVAPQSAKFVRRWAYRDAGQLVAISAAVVDSIAKRFDGIDLDIVADAVAGFDANVDETAAIRAKFAGKTLIGHIGALDHSHKGQSSIIDAARLVEHEHTDWQFLICGEGEDRQRYQDEIGDLKNVSLLGWIDNVGDYLASFDVFLYPSLHEALGSSLLDAMQFGLPIVASNVDGIPAVVEDGVNGLLIEPESPKQMVDAINSLLADEGRLPEMRQCNQSRAAQYSVGLMADCYQAIYHRISPRSHP